MNIRTITGFLNPGCPPVAERLAAVAELLTAIKGALEAAHYPVQTVRLATVPFPALLCAEVPQTIRFAQELETLCFAYRIDHAAIGPARLTDGPEFFRIIPEIIGATEHVFASAVIAAPASGVSLAAVKLAAEIIQRCAALSPDGLGNLRFAALANVPPGAPFFPAAYAPEGPPAFALGVEAAPLAVTACAEAASLADARSRLIAAVEAHAQTITGLVKKYTGRGGLHFAGLDFSLAPYPDEARSVGTALERLTGGRVGEHGTLAAAAFLADTLDRAQFKRAGFSGLFLPVLEDSRLAQRAAEGVLTVSDLLLYSTVCGAGLDTVPLPGDVSQEALAAILLDVGALALRLNKPLAARLMPLPGKQAGDELTLDFPYFAPSRVLAPHTTGLGGLLAAADNLALEPHPK
jgi:uncharacterized protein